MTSFNLRSVIGGTLTPRGAEGGACTPGVGLVGGWEGVGRGGVTASHCKDSSLTNKPLLLIINGNEGPLSVSVCVCECVLGLSVRG